MPPLPYRPAWWVPGPHAQTLWGKFARRIAPVPTHVERIETPDSDFIELHRLPAPAGSDPRTPRVLLLHGLEGTIRSHYAQGLLAEMHRRGWAVDLLLFRSCGDELNRTRRFYHSGETSDLALAIDHVQRENPSAPLGLVGVSLGGNVLLKYLGELGEHQPPYVTAAVAISVPFDLGRGARHIQRGFSKVYERHFLRSLKRKVRAKMIHFPDLVPPDQLAKIETLVDFDDVVTAPLHDFANADAYYSASSAIRFLSGIRTKTLLLSAVDDPFLPAQVLAEVREVARANSRLVLEFPDQGGHAGFVGGTNPLAPDYYLERRAGEFLAAVFGV